MLTPEEVRHVAMLARLGLTDDEVATMQTQLVGVLDYIAMLDRVDVSHIPPTAQILSHLNVTRPDAVEPSLSLDQVMANAPAREGDLIRVPAVLEEGKPDKQEDRDA